jgi:hypothetical protein
VNKKFAILLGTVAALSVGSFRAVAQTGQPPMFGGPGFGPPPPVGDPMFGAPAFASPPFPGRLLAGPRFGPPPLPPPGALWAQLTPAEICRDAAAHVIGHFAYLKARLDLTAAQEPLWGDITTAATDIAAAERDMCGRLPSAQQPPDLATRLGVAEQHAATIQQNLQKISGPLRKLYETLTPDQRAIMDRALPPPLVF